MNETLRNLKEQLRKEYQGKCRSEEVRQIKAQIEYYEQLEEEEESTNKQHIYTCGVNKLDT